MHIRIAIAALFVLGSAGMGLGDEKKCAAYDPDNDGESEMAWGATCEEAKHAAIQNCTMVSDTCGSSPAWTDNLDNVFVTMCCEHPRFGCQTSIGPDIETAKALSLSIFEKAGFSQCWQSEAMSARTGLDVK